MSRLEKYIVMAWLTVLTGIVLWLASNMMQIVRILDINTVRLMELFFFVTGQVQL